METFLTFFGPSSRQLAPNASNIIVLATAQSEAALHPLIMTAHLFKRAIHLKPPSKDTRRQVRDAALMMLGLYRARTDDRVAR